jgi:1-carboxybiuret hydrolase subunit AtzG-like
MARVPDDAAIDPEISAYVGAAARVLCLRIPAGQREGVERHFARIAFLARLVDAQAPAGSDTPTAVSPGTRA